MVAGCGSDSTSTAGVGSVATSAVVDAAANGDAASTTTGGGAVSTTEPTVSEVGGDPSQDNAFEYVVQAGDFPIGLAERFCLKSWRDIFAVNGWASEDEFPLPGTVILMPTDCPIEGDEGNPEPPCFDSAMVNPSGNFMSPEELLAQIKADLESANDDWGATDLAEWTILRCENFGRIDSSFAGAATWVIESEAGADADATEYLAVIAGGPWVLVTSGTAVDGFCPDGSWVAGKDLSAAEVQAVERWCALL